MMKKSYPTWTEVKTRFRHYLTIYANEFRHPRDMYLSEAIKLGNVIKPRMLSLAKEIKAIGNYGSDMEWVDVIQEDFYPYVESLTYRGEHKGISGKFIDRLGAVACTRCGEQINGIRYTKSVSPPVYFFVPAELFYGKSLKKIAEVMCNDGGREITL